MRKAVIYGFAALVLGQTFTMLRVRLDAANPSNRQADIVQTSRWPLRLMPLYHGSVMLEFGGSVIPGAPWSQADYTGLPAADMILVTHTHADHLDRAMIDK